MQYRFWTAAATGSVLDARSPECMRVNMQGETCGVTHP